MNINDKSNFLLVMLVGFFASAIVTTTMYNTITFNLWSLMITMGGFTFVLASSSLDIIHEFYGKQMRKKVVLVGAMMRLLFFIITILSLHFGEASEGTHQFLGELARIMIASETALLIGQYIIDPFIYGKIAEKLKGKYTTLRVIVSNSISISVGTSIFVWLSFYGIKPLNIVQTIWYSNLISRFPLIIFSSFLAGFSIWLIKKYIKLPSLQDKYKLN